MVGTKIINALLLGPLCLWLSFAAATGATAGAPAERSAEVAEDSLKLQLAVVAPRDDDHLAWAAVGRLVRHAADYGVEVAVQPASRTVLPGSLPDLFLMPVRSLATQVPELEVLELPFLYSSLEAVHEAVDGALGTALETRARERGWEILAYWDEGMHVLSGLKRYDRVRNLRIREFLLTRPDPVAERQFHHWRAYPRRINPRDREAVLRECLIASRAATLQELVREELFRAHLAVSLSRHRYEGWVVVSPHDQWVAVDEQARRGLRAALRETTAWQREDARRREEAALVRLQEAGMSIFEVDDAERRAFRGALPNPAELLSPVLDREEREAIVALASVGTAGVVPPEGGPAAADARRDPAPGAVARQGHQQAR
ncbi:MAG: TRAP transporter substrate-binding protein DctP [Gammaproteobacteria bacterium]|nr:TRAP transporter substrate-binding protein DctP [Gammaproteobacteria bacterium]